MTRSAESNPAPEQVPHYGAQHARRRGRRTLHFIAGAALAIGVPSAIIGFAFDDALALAVSAGLIGCAVLVADASRARQGGLSPMTLYVLAWTLASFANIAGMLNQDTAERPLYFLYAVDEHLPVAMQIAWVGLVMPVLGFYWLMRSPTWRTAGTLLPRVRGYIPERQLLGIGVGAAGFAIAANITNVLPSLGTLTAILYFVPHLAAFTLARAGTMRRWPTAVWIALAIAIAEAARALVSAYLRSDIISPIFAYAAGVMMGGRSFKVLRSIYMAPVYALAIPFVVYFAAFADVRGKAIGLERVQVVHEQQSALAEAGQSSRHSLVTRLSNFNQLSQVVMVVDEDGLRYGETLEYLAYAWIPRFLWPEKPEIAKGAWFAYRIGQARLFQGRITNSVNMTVPGEFYMNFGWLGLLLGPFVFGAFLALLWQTTSFWERSHDALGSAFGFYLMWVGIIGGADLQIIITVVAVYLIFVTASQFTRYGHAEVRDRKAARQVATVGSNPA